MWWRIFYGDGNTFSDEDGSPFDAPRTGVLAVVRQDNWVGYIVVHANDYYCLDPECDGWYCTDLIGMADYLTRCKHPLVLFGRMTSTTEYRDLLTRIRHTYGDIKTGFQPEEVKRGT